MEIKSATINKETKVATFEVMVEHEQYAVIKRESYVYPNTTAIRCVDGDTIHALVTVNYNLDLGFSVTTFGGGQARPVVRILDLDTPEIFHPRNAAEKQHGLEAKAFAEKLLSTPFTMETFKTSNQDNYGRYLAKITLSDGRDFATVMKENGFQKRANY